VLYVMLVARFPEFRSENGGLVVNLTTPMWAGISELAKSLIRGLMTADPDVRMTVREALQHPWLGVHRASSEELTVEVCSVTAL
jgi:serine/threonine protein kinase